GSILRADEAVVGALFRTVGCAPSLLEPVRERDRLQQQHGLDEARPAGGGELLELLEEGRAGEVLPDQHVVAVLEMLAGEGERESPRLQAGSVQVPVPAAQGVLQRVDVQGERERTPGGDAGDDRGFPTPGRTAQEQQRGCLPRRVHRPPPSLARRGLRSILRCGAREAMPAQPTLARGAPMPGSILGTSPLPGRMSMSKMSSGRYTVAQALGMSTTPENRPSMGAAPSSRYACSFDQPKVERYSIACRHARW